MTRLTMIVCALALTAACSDDDGGTADAAASASDAAIVADAPGPTADAATAPDAALCNTMANEGTKVDQTAVGEVAPAAMGGVIGDGTFVVTADLVYTGVGGQAGPTGNTIQATSTNSGTNFEYVEDIGNGDSAVSGTFTTVDTTITITATCPPPGGGTGWTTFTETVDGFILYDTTQIANGIVFARTYTKLP